MRAVRWHATMKPVTALQSGQMKGIQLDTIGTWPAITGVAIECIVLGWLLLSEKPSKIFFHEKPLH